MNNNDTREKVEKCFPAEESRPLVTFYVVAYNQESFIQAAIEGAFAQTWSPLEIILSDDCSTDNTYAIMQNAAANYHGPHTVIVNRNLTNLGVGAHISRILEISHGDLIVASAGDDVSVPERAECLCAHWMRSAGEVFLLYSNLLEIDENGAELFVHDFVAKSKIAPDPSDEVVRWSMQEHLQNLTPPVHGASFAYPRILYSKFDAFIEGTIFEDNVLNWRAEGLGKVVLLRKPLVMHRNHSGQITNTYTQQNVRENSRRRKAIHYSDMVTLWQNMADIKVLYAGGHISQAQLDMAGQRFESHLRWVQAEYDALYGKWPGRIICIFRRLVLHKQHPIQRPISFLVRALAPVFLYGMAVRVVISLRMIFARRPAR